MKVGLFQAAFPSWRMTDILSPVNISEAQLLVSPDYRQIHREWTVALEHHGAKNRTRRSVVDSELLIHLTCSCS